MSQPNPSQSQPDMQLQGHHVTNYIHHMQQRDQTFMQNIKACRDTILDAAQLYADEKDEGKLTELRQQLIGLIKEEQQLKRHSAALGQLQYTYQPSLDVTNFEHALDQQMQQQAAMDGFNAAADEDLKDFDVIRGGEEQQQQEEELEDEDELLVVGNVEKNEKCPYTRKDVAELDEPLEDQMGFIYEGAAIRAEFRRALQERFNWIECPLPGVSHKIFLEQLKPANKRRLQRMAKLKQRQQAQQQTQQQQAGAQGRTVLDI